MSSKNWKRVSGLVNKVRVTKKVYRCKERELSIRRQGKSSGDRIQKGKVEKRGTIENEKKRKT